MFTINENFVGGAKDEIVVKSPQIDYGSPGFMIFKTFYMHEFVKSNSYMFLEEPVLETGVTIQNDRISEFAIQLAVPPNRVETFFLSVVEHYGAVQSIRVLQQYLQNYGYENPTKVATKNYDTYYKDLPEPKIADYKYLESLSWNGLKDNEGKLDCE
ncbi:Hypothetical protein I595_3024 [Croceitalea dokdonensis DOKDO 023]|uniref:Uncharacterized protein n=2 Tax=Croceitalea TaxID=574891 RepID=A0A0P7ACX9_9FLAO|nr:Hypothetical protein I595_3024 [Croceitalea dokdonensis DOKDO 023]